MSKHTPTHNTEQDYAQSIARLFKDFASSLQADAKRFNDEQRKAKERLESGTKLTKHRITL